MFRRHPIWISIAVSALMLVVLGAAELAARKYAPAQGTSDYEQFLLDSSGLLFRPEIVQGRQEMIPVSRHPSFQNVQRFAFAKPTGLLRLVVIGESSARKLGGALCTVVARDGLSQRLEIMGLRPGEWVKTA